MRYLLIVLWYCFLMSNALGQANTDQQGFVIKKPRIFDYESIFTVSEIRQLDSILNDCWKRGIAEIAIVTIDDRHTDKENFDNYVIQNLTAYAFGEYERNNGIVIALSKKMRQMRIQNGSGITKILSDGNTKKIIDEQFIPKFKEGKYFEGTLNGLNTIISFAEKARKQEDFIDITSIFSSAIFKKIRSFVLENGTRQTFRNLDNENPSYSFNSLDVFFGPSRKSAFVLKDFLYEDYYEMTIMDAIGSYYQFVHFDKNPPEKTFIHKKMQPQKVYWQNPNGKSLSSDVWPLLEQIESEMTQNVAVNKAKPFTEYQWVLKQEFHPMERIYTDTDNNDTLSFVGSDLFINGKDAGSFDIKREKRILSLKINDGEQPPFAIFPMDDRYHYRYLFNKEQKKLYLVPLDEKEGNDLICVEGCTLVFGVSERQE